jgi:type I restriction enzyme, S subunit
MIHWTQSRLGDVLTVIRGVSYKKEVAKSQPADGYVPILRATNIQDRLMFDELVYVPRSNVSPEQQLRKGDIVVAASSGSRAVVGKAAQLNEDWNGSFGAFCFGLRPSETVNPRFVGWFLQTREYRNRVSGLAAV